jgi:serine/threonine protein kinase
MLEKKHTLNKRKSVIFRTSTIITVNDNSIEKINLDEYKLEQKIGKTNLASVYICRHIKTNKIYTMKIMKKIDVLHSKIVERLTNEFKIMANVYHPFIIELKGINNTNPYTLNFLFEFIPGGTLNSLIKSHKRLPITNARFYLASLVTVIDYLHKRNIIYRDLNPENILINSNGFIKLADFSFAKKLENNDVTYSVCGQPEYYSPEMINKLGYNTSSDFWSLGIFLYEMLIGCTPFMDQDPMKIYQKINKAKVIFPKFMDKNTKMIIKQFLTIDVNKRLGCSKKGVFEIVDHPFFEGFDWKGLLYRTLEPPFIPVVNGPNDISNYKVIDNKKISYDEDCVDIDKEKDPFYNW